MHIETGCRLTELRRSRGLSQEELAERIGVSRQAVSNWERSESLPDTANVLRLAELYEVSLDEIVGREPLESQDQICGDSSSAEDERSTADRRSTWVWFASCAILSFVYYAFICQPLLTFAVNDISEVFGLGLGAPLAAAWLVAEVAFVLVPFLVLAVLPIRQPRGIWIAPLVVFAAPILVILAGAGLGGSATVEYSGAGGALVSSLALRVDALALLGGCTLVFLSNRRREALHSVGWSEPTRCEGSSA